MSNNKLIRIKNKHLITLEPAISENQTNQMLIENVTLVIPSSISQTYSRKQNTELMVFNDFIELIREKQIHSSN